MSGDVYRAGVMDLAERHTGLGVQFARLAGIYELSRSHRSFDRFASLLRAAKEAGTEVSFEILGTRIVSVE